MQPLTRLLGGALLACGLTTALHAEPISLGHTINPAPAAIFMADQQGLFARNGLDLSLEVMTADPIIPAALMSGSVDLATLSPTTFLTAVTNGLDLEAIAGTAITTADSKDIVIVAGSNSGIKTAADFAGKTVGVPGIGALLDVMFREWLSAKGVDPSTVTYIEVPFPQHAAQLQAGRVDAVMTASQFAGPMIGAGYGVPISYPVSELPPGKPTLVVVGTRDWIDSHPDDVATFRASVADAQAISATNPDAVRSALANAMHLPPPVAERIALPTIDVSLSADGLGFWNDALVAQGVIPGGLDLNTLVLP